MKVRPIFRYDSQWPKLRLFRAVWTRGTVGDGHGYSRKVGIALRPRLFEFIKGRDAWRLVVCGIEVHSAKSWGGSYV
jgi:hypothetical protein